MKRPKTAAITSPVLIGAMTVLILLVAVFLAYNANNGLPFVPTQELKVNIGNGSDLTVGADVREGGFRVGLLSQMRPIRLANGETGAQLVLELQKTYKYVPVDSTVRIRPQSVLGTKFIDIHTGHEKKYISDGGTLPIAQTNVPVQFDDIFKTFRYQTRIDIQNNLQGYGDGLAGRGSSLNDTISSLNPLLLHLQPVAHYLSQPSTELTRFLNAANQLTGAIAPVKGDLPPLFRDMSTTFSALVNTPQSPPGQDIENTIAKSPGTLSTGTTSLRAQQPFLADLSVLGVELQPPTADLKPTLEQLNPAIEQGTRVLGRTPPLDQKLKDTLNSLKDLALAPHTNEALNALSDTTATLNPMLHYLGPFVTVCDDWNYFWTYLAEHLSAVTNYGFAQRVLLNLGATNNNGVGQQGANHPANGAQSLGPLFGGVEYLHAPPYGAAVDTAGNADCETGQRGYPYKLNHLDPQNRAFDTDPHTPGDQGATYAGLSHVPPGETYAREPDAFFGSTAHRQASPELPPISGNQ